MTQTSDSALASSAPLEVGALRHPTESSRFALALIATAAGTAFVIFALLVALTTAELLTPLLVVASGFAAFWLALQLWRVRLLADAVRVDAATLPELDAIVRDVRARLDYHGRAEVFVVDRLIRVVANETRTATVTSFFGVRVILLEGGLVGDLSRDDSRRQCTFLLATLLGALKARHAQWGSVLDLLRALKLTVVVAPLVTPWLRATVYTGDRLAYACCGDLDVSLRAAYRTLVGGDVAPQLRTPGLIGQALTVRHSRILRLAQLLRSTPHVPNRYLEVLAFAGARQPMSFQVFRAGLDEPAGLDAVVSRHRRLRDRAWLVPAAVVTAITVLIAALVGGVIGKAPAKDWMRTSLEAKGLAPETSESPKATTDEPKPSPAQADLMAVVPSSMQASCSFIDHTTFGPATTAALGCKPGNGATEVDFLAFDDGAALRQKYSEITGPLPENGSCDAGKPTKTAWHNGDVACFQTAAGRHPALVWTDEQYDVLAVAIGEGTSLADLHDWWLGQPRLGT